MSRTCRPSEHASSPFHVMNGTVREGLAVCHRRSMLKVGLSGMAGLTLPALLQQRQASAASGGNVPSGKSIILLWMTGGPSHIDTWDMKPDRPLENRGPFSPIATSVPGVHICEHLPKQAAMLDKFTIIRSVDCKGSSHEPNMVMQTGHREAAPRTNPKGRMYPAIGSMVSKFHGANAEGVPAYAAFRRSDSHLAFSGYLGQQYDPFIANDAAQLPIYDLVGKDSGRKTPGTLFQLSSGLDPGRLNQRHSLVRQFDRLQGDLDRSGSMDSLSTFQQQAIEMVTGRRIRQAFDLSGESDATRERYGNHLWCQQALLARRLVEAGSAFVTIDLSYHTASGTWDTHGDNIPPYGGIKNGLGPILPLFDHLLTTLVDDLDQRGLLDDCMVVAMGEFGRTPQMGTQGSSDGRNHWPQIMSMCLAGGGYRHGQVIGASEKDGSVIAERPVTPGDLTATMFRHFGIPIGSMYDDNRGRPRYAVQENGQPLPELV